MPYEDIYNPDTSKYKGDFSSSLSTSPPLSMSPTDAYYGGYMDKGDLQSSTSTLREVSSTLRTVLSQFTGAISTTFNTLRNMTTQQNAASQQMRLPGIGQSIVQPSMSPEAGRYVGSATFLESARGALTGRPGSPYLLNSDYQQLMSENFARRSTIFGGSVASVAAEMGGGWLGAKTLGPMIAKGMLGKIAGGIGGYMGVGYLASHAMGRVNQGLEFDSLLQDTSSRMGINEGGAGSRGFSSNTRRKMAKEFRGESRKYGGLGMGDYADIMEYGTEYGLFQGVTDPQQFTETVKNAAKQLKTLMKVMREPDVRNAIKDMATFKQWGVPQGQMISFAMHADAVGRATGMTTQGVLGHMAGGVQMARQMGMPGSVGMNMGAHSLTMAKGIEMSGTQTTSEIQDSVYRLTGDPEGDARKYAEALSVKAVMAADTMHGRELIAALSKRGEDGKFTVDEQALKDLKSGKLSYEDIQEKAREKMDVSTEEGKELGVAMQNMPELVAQMVPETDDLNQIISRGIGIHTKNLLETVPGLSPGLAAKTAAGAAGFTAKDALALEEQQPSTDMKKREKASIEKVQAAKIEAAKNPRGIYGLWKKGDEIAHGWDPVNWWNKATDSVVDYAVGVPGRIKEFTDKHYEEKGLGLHLSTMPGGVIPKGMASPGPLSPQAKRRVQGVVDSTTERAGKTATPEHAAIVYGDEIKNQIEFFGSSEEDRSPRLGGMDYAGLYKSTGEKLLDAGAYKNVKAYSMALTAASKGGDQEEYLEKISEEWKASDTDSKQAKELYEILKEAMESGRLAREQMIEQYERIDQLNKKALATGHVPGEALKADVGEIPDRTRSKEEKDAAPFREGVAKAWDAGDRAVDKYYHEPVSKAFDATKSAINKAWDAITPEKGQEFSDVGDYAPDVSKIEDDPTLAVKDSGGGALDRYKKSYLSAESVVTEALSPESETDPRFENADGNVGDFGMRSVPVDRKKRFKTGKRKADHGKERFRPLEQALYRPHEDIVPAKSDTLSQFTDFDAWSSKWGGVDLDNIQASPEPVTGNAGAAGGKKAWDPFAYVEPGTAPVGPGYTGPRSKDYIKEAQVQVGEGKSQISVPVSMAKHYKQGAEAITPIQPAPDVSPQGAGDDTSSTEAAVASKALGSSQGGLAQNAEKTSKSLEKVNKGLGTFATKLESIFLRATKSSNHY